MMKLLLLRCPVCAEPLPAGNEAVVLTCPHCVADVLLDEQSGVSTTAVSFSQPANPTAQATHWLPFWVLLAQVQLDKRQTQGGNKSAAQDAERMWSVPRWLFTPAWALPVPQARQIGSELVLRQPAITPFAQRPAGARLTTAVLTPDSAQKFLNFIILTIEAERADWLKELKFQIIPSQPATLWALPATQTGDQYKLLV
jgi:hypothetical protein